MPLVSVRPNNVYKGDIFEELLAKVDVVAVDLDGTLLNARADVDDLTASAIRRASAAGIRVIPATGRVLSVLPETLTAIQDIEYAVCCAGATVLRMDESRDCCFALKDDGFEPNEAAEIVGMIIHRYRGDVLVDFSCEGVMYSERSMLAELESFDVPGLSIATCVDHEDRSTISCTPRASHRRPSGALTYLRETSGCDLRSCLHSPRKDRMN